MNRLFLVLAFGATMLSAQPQGFGQAFDPGQDSPQDDPPSRVARLNWLSGDVAFQPATVDSWTNATVNYPLTTGDHLYVNPGGRAELHIAGSAIHLNSTTNFGFLNLDDSIVQMSLNEGSVEIRLRRLDQGDTWEIDTPNGAVTLLRAGDYRIDTDPVGNSTTVTAITGQAEMYQEGNSVLITAHQSAVFRGNNGPQVMPEYPRDDFDSFAEARENAEDALPRQGDYVPDSMIGSEDLYAYGRWTSDPLYGQIWFPPVDPGWTPYSRGRWAFVEPWGWTWIDEAPWGFAPFHYGRWAMVRGGWAWIPGERTYRPVYAPALVGFIGVDGFGLSVGWFPLGPHEPWVPGWHASRAYVNRVNVMHVTNINVVNVTNINYVNRERVTVVSQADFAGARSVRASAIQVAPGQIRDARVIGYSPKIAPVRNSVVVGSAHPVPPVPIRVVQAHTAPPPAPVSFQARQQMLAQNNGQPLRREQVEQLRSQQPAAVVSRPEVRPIGSMRTARPGFQPVQQPQVQQPQVQEQPQQPGFRPGREVRPAVNAAQPNVPANPAPANGNSPNPGNFNRVPDRMNSRPAGVQNPAVQPPSQPTQTVAPSRPPAEVRPAPAPQQETPRPAQTMRPVPESRPAPQPQPQQQQEPRPAERRVERPAPPAPQVEKPAEPAKPSPRKRPEQQQDQKQ